MNKRAAAVTASMIRGEEECWKEMGILGSGFFLIPDNETTNKEKII